MYRLKVFLIVLVIAGCAVNPVTGERHLQFYGSDWENSVGAQMYAPMKQSEGGDFVLDPELTAYVQEVGNRLAQHARRKSEIDFEFSVINNSQPNAWALPGGKIVINRGLLTELNSEAELAAVLGHEIVHADAAHGARAQSKGVITQIGTVAGMIIAGTTLDSPAAREMGMLVPMVGAQLVTQKYGRDAEREADLYGMRYMAEAGYDAEGAVELQETFVRLSEGRNQDWLSGLFASHPPSQERVENNRETENLLAAEGYEGGETGKSRWEEKTAYLRRVEPAYEYYGKAREAAAEGDWGTAQKQLNAAMKIEPRESLFLAMQGDIHAEKDKTRKALQSYDAAVAANDGFFYGWLRRGLANYELGNESAARRDLEHSVELMPTAQAHHALGQLDLKDNRRASAMDHFRIAAQSQSPVGALAERDILELELPEQAARYVAAQLAVNSKGEVWVQIGNQTRTPLDNIRYDYAWIDDSGQTRRGSGEMRGIIEGGKWAQEELNVRISGAGDINRRVQVQITSAELVE